MATRLSRHAADKPAEELSEIGLTIDRELLEEVIRKPDEILYDSVTAIYSSSLDGMVHRRKMSGEWI